MSFRRRITQLLVGGACALAAGPSAAQDYSLCVKLEARLIELDRHQSGGSSVNIVRHDPALAEQRRLLSVARREAQRAGCGPQTGFLFFRPQRPLHCGQFDAEIRRLETAVSRLEAQGRRSLPVATGATGRERRDILAMLGENNCGPQYARYAPNRQGGLFGFFFRDYTRDPYMEAPAGGSFYGTYRTLCVRTCDGYYWPISFSTVSGHFENDEYACRASCPASNVALFVHRNPGEGPEEAVSLDGQSYTSLPAAFRYRTEYVPECTCKSETQTAALSERIVVQYPGGENIVQDVPAFEPAATPLFAEVPLPRARPGPEQPVAGAIATVTGLEDFDATSAPRRAEVAGRSVRIVGPGFTLYRSADE